MEVIQNFTNIKNQIYILNPNTSLIAVTKGPKALTIAIPIKEGSHDAAPKLSSEGRDCLGYRRQ